MSDINPEHVLVMEIQRYMFSGETLDHNIQMRMHILTYILMSIIIVVIITESLLGQTHCLGQVIVVTGSRMVEEIVTGSRMGQQIVVTGSRMTKTLRDGIGLEGVGIIH